MLHQLNHHAVAFRLDLFQWKSKTEQLKREGYREFREPRITRHWANR